MPCPGAAQRASQESTSLADGCLAALEHVHFDRVKHVRDAAQEAINTFNGLKVQAAPFRLAETLRPPSECLDGKQEVWAGS